MPPGMAGPLHVFCSVSVWREVCPFPGVPPGNRIVTNAPAVPFFGQNILCLPFTP